MIVVQYSMSFVIRLLFVSSLFIISHPLAFVKRFFKLFSSFLQILSDSLSRLSAACILYHSRFRLSRGFSNFFQVFCGSFFGSARSLVDSLYSISHQVNFVKSFFKLFSSFFDLLLVFPLSLRQLRYCTTSSQACQYLFDSFCLFVYYNQPP